MKIIKMMFWILAVFVKIMIFLVLLLFVERKICPQFFREVHLHKSRTNRFSFLVFFYVMQYTKFFEVIVVVVVIIVVVVIFVDNVFTVVVIIVLISCCSDSNYNHC